MNSYNSTTKQPNKWINVQSKAWIDILQRRCATIKTLAHYWWECTVLQSLQKTICMLFWKIKNRTARWSRNSTSGYVSKITVGRISKRYLYTHVCCSIFTIAKRRKQAKYPLLGEKTKKNYHVDKQWNITGLAREGNCCILQHRWIMRMFC